MTSSMNWSICTLSFALIACHSNPADRPPVDASPPIDAIPPIDAPTGPVELALLAGDIGGPGNLDGVGTAARFASPGGVAVDGAGNIYVAEVWSNTIRKITAAGVVTTLAGTTGLAGYTDGTGAAARFHFPGGVAADSAGNVYVADTYNHLIRKITAAGEVTALAGHASEPGSTDGTVTTARFYNPGGVAVDSADNIYVADTDNSTIRKITPAGVVTTLAGTAGMTGSADATTGTDARFNHPSGMAVDSAGNVYVADTGNHIIRKITPAGNVTTLAGATGELGSADATGIMAHFYYPGGVAIDSVGNVYVADTYNHLIRKITPAGVVTTLAGAAGMTDSTDGTGTAARFYNPSDVGVDGAGNVYVADLGNYAIRKITPGAEVTTLAGAPILRWESTDGTGAAARFNLPNGVAADRAGNVYVADTSNCTIRKITAGGVTTLAGMPGKGGSTDGAGNAARFYFPRGVAVDRVGNIYVADTENHTIRKVTPAGVVTTLAGTAGTWGITDGTGAAALFKRPFGVAVDSAGNVYIADTGNHTIRKIAPAGEVTTLAGTAGVPGSLPGRGTDARFYDPTGVAVDSTGNVYVADRVNHTIRKIDSNRDVTALAGPISIWMSGSTDATGAAARFNLPIGVAVDSADNVYVADEYNSAIRKVTTPEGVTTTIAGVAGMTGISLGTTPRLAYPRALAVTGDSIVIVDTGAVLMLRHGAR